MKRVLRYLPVIAILTFISPSCVEKIEFEGDAMETKIVLYSILQPDSVITVFISKSHAVFDYKFEPVQITDAVVKLYRDGELAETLAYVAPSPQPEYHSPVLHSKYVSKGIKPVPGSTYRIEAEIPTLKTVAGETSLPDIVPIEKIDTASYKQDEMRAYLVAKVRFDDPGGRDNYYMVSGRQKNGHYNGNPAEPWYPGSSVSVTENDLYLGADDEPLIAPNLNEDPLGIYSNNFRVFTDELIGGRQYDLTLKLSYMKPDTAHYEFSCSQIYLQSITRDLYMYLLSYSAHVEASDAYISEPVLVYTNVENGLGVVGARSFSSATIQIGRYPVEKVNYRYRN